MFKYCPASASLQEHTDAYHHESNAGVEVLSGVTMNGELYSYEAAYLPPA
jgi:hypothetical protein